MQEWLADCIELEPAVKKYPILIDYSPVYGAQSLNHAIQNERLNLLSMLILGDCVHDSEWIKPAQLHTDCPEP